MNAHARSRSNAVIVAAETMIAVAQTFVIIASILNAMETRGTHVWVIAIRRANITQKLTT